MTLNTSTENRYQYNGKELEKDFGIDLSDYGARWYDASIGRFTTVDPLASDYSFQSPYAYATNNPVLLRDIMGMGVETEIFNRKGKKVGEDENGNDGNIIIVTNKVVKKLRRGKISFDEASVSASAIKTTRTIIGASIGVLDRASDTGREQGAIVSREGKVEEVGLLNGTTHHIDFPEVKGSDNTSIHSHPLGYKLATDNSVIYGYGDATAPGPDDIAKQGYGSHVIVGRLGIPSISIIERNRGGGERVIVLEASLGAAFYSRDFGKPIGVLELKTMQKISKD